MLGPDRIFALHPRPWPSDNIILTPEESMDVLTTSEVRLTFYFDQGGKKNCWNENSIMTCLRLVPRFNFSSWVCSYAIKSGRLQIMLDVMRLASLSCA